MSYKEALKRSIETFTAISEATSEADDLATELIHIQATRAATEARNELQIHMLFPAFGSFEDANITDDDLAAGLTADQIARLKNMIELAVGKAYFTGYEDGYRQAIEFKPEYGFPGSDPRRPE